MSNVRPLSAFMEKHYLHFNAAALVDAAQGYKAHLAKGRKMMVTLAGAMSTAELGKILAEMIRQGQGGHHQLHRCQPGRGCDEPGGPRPLRARAELPRPHPSSRSATCWTVA
jgi:hypothetical protein